MEEVSEKTKKTTEAEIIQAALLAAMIDYLEKAVKYSEKIGSQEELEVLEEQQKKLIRMGLENSKNAQLIRARIDEVQGSARKVEMAKDLIEYTKKIRAYFGPSHTLLVSRKAFLEILGKYSLTMGKLENYTGLIPDQNLQEIMEVQKKITEMPSDISRTLGYGLWDITSSYVPRITGISVSEGEKLIRKHGLVVMLNNNEDIKEGDSGTEFIQLKNLLEKDKYLKQLYNMILPIKRDTYIFGDLLEKPWSFDGLQTLFGMIFDITKADSKSLYIACPEYDLRVPENFRTQQIEQPRSENRDPIIFQNTPYGILIHSMWGKESEDIVLEEYKRINGLIGL